MKVIREGESFKPIHVVLETDDEAHMMWHILNRGGQDLKEYCADHGLSEVSFTRFKDKAWNDLEDVLHYTKTDC